MGTRLAGRWVGQLYPELSFKVEETILLASCVIFLKVNKEVMVPPSMGQILHAFFLDSVRAQDPDLAEDLHRPEPVKPYTISQLRGKVSYEDNRWRLSPGEVYFFRITAISPEFSRWLQEKWTKSLPREIKLAGASFILDGHTFESAHHPWAGVTSYEEIYSSVISRPVVAGKFHIEFCSPTTFRVGGSNYPLPDPQKVFINLLQKWNKYSPIHLGNNYTEFIEKNVFPSAHKLQTWIMHFDKYKQVGFTGACTFGIRRTNEDIIARVLFMLAEYAFYAGIGYKTTMGMGQGRAVR